jgi:hypothetical protein
MSVRVADHETGFAGWVGRFFGPFLGIALGIAPFVLIGLILFALVSVLNHREVDPGIPPAYATATSAMQDLPGISCPKETQYRYSQVCAWGGWRMEMSMGTAAVGRVCAHRDEHVVYGGSDWILFLKPATVVSSLPALSSDEDSQLRAAFTLGNGVNWQAC